MYVGFKVFDVNFFVNNVIKEFNMGYSFCYFIRNFFIILIKVIVFLVIIRMYFLENIRIIKVGIYCLKYNFFRVFFFECLLKICFLCILLFKENFVNSIS